MCFGSRKFLGMDATLPWSSVLPWLAAMRSMVS